jgi:thiol-disulfide isomerase/thioredoxin
MRRAGLAVLAAVLLTAGCTGDQPAPSYTEKVAGLAACPPPGSPSGAAQGLPDLTLACLGADGTPGVPLRRLTGTPLVLNLWASWCAPCRQELPAFARLADDAGPRLRVVGVATSDRPADSVTYAQDAKVPFPSLVDRSGDLGRALRRRGLPVTVLVAADGTVAKVYQGTPLTDGTLRALVRQALRVDV